MHAEALIVAEGPEFAVRPITLPDPGDEDVVVRTLWSGVSIGTEFALIRKKLTWGPFPLCTGYQGVGVVESVGADVRGFRPGDRVYYRDNRPSTLVDGTPVSAVSGVHASRAVIHPGRTHGLAALPDGCPVDAASLFVMPAVGLHGVDLAQVRLGWKVIVHGVGLIGLGVVAFCALRGCQTLAIDLNDRRLDVALKFGADFAINARAPDARERIHAFATEGADAVFETTGIPDLILPCIELCRPLGVFVWQGNYGGAPFPFHFLPPHMRRLTMVFPCDDGLEPSRQAVVKAMTSGALPWQQTITHRVEYRDAPGLYGRILANDPDVLGAAIRWSSDGAVDEQPL